MLLKMKVSFLRRNYIDKTFAKENAPTRKPNTGLLANYFSEEYDLTILL